MPPPSEATIDSIISVINCRIARDLRHKTTIDGVEMCKRNYETFWEADHRGNMLIIAQIMGLAELIVMLSESLGHSAKDQFPPEIAALVGGADKAGDHISSLLRDLAGGFILSGGDPGLKKFLKAKERFK